MTVRAKEGATTSTKPEGGVEPTLGRMTSSQGAKWGMTSTVQQEERATYPASQGGEVRFDIEPEVGVMFMAELGGRVMSEVKQEGAAMSEAESGGGAQNPPPRITQKDVHGLKPLLHGLDLALPPHMVAPLQKNFLDTEKFCHIPRFSGIHGALKHGLLAPGWLTLIVIQTIFPRTGDSGSSCMSCEH